MTEQRDVKALILAAGRGTRMKSDRPKVLFEVAGKPMVQYVADACKNSGISDILLVIGYKAEDVKETLGDQYNYVLQKEQLGTGHAVKQAVPYFMGFVGDIVMLVGDSPFVSPDLIKPLISLHRETGVALTLTSTVFENPPPYGRVVKDADGNVKCVIEEKDASPEILKIKEVSTSHICFKAEVVLPLLSELKNNNVKNEFYFTDIVGILTSHGYKVVSHKIDDQRSVLGINSLEDLELAEKLLG